MSDGHDRTVGTGADKTDGTAVFTADVSLPGMLYVAFRLAATPHARIRAVDATAALAVPGVVAVVTAEDTGLALHGRAIKDYPVLAADRVLFAGQRVAAVAAEDRATARSAAELVDIDGDDSDALFDPVRAQEPITPQLHPDFATYVGPDRRASGHNVQGEEAIDTGGVDGAFAESDTVHAHEFSWPRSHSAPLEPHACTLWSEGDTIHVVSTHKQPFKLRRELAAVTGRDEGDFVIEPVHLGGDFGAKGNLFVEGACYHLCMATGRPVSTVMTYAELLTSTSARHAGTMTVRTGLRDGAIHAHETATVLDGGAFAAIKPRATLVPSIVGIPLAPYDVAHRRERAVSVYTNNLPSGQVRGPGEFQATFAGESHIDIIARAAGIDPLTFRLAHAGVPEARRVLHALAPTVAQWRDRVADATGVGISVFHRGTGVGRARVACVARRDHIEVQVGIPDQGAGSYTAIAAVAAAALGVAATSVVVRDVGTAGDLLDPGVGGSRVTGLFSRACSDACRQLRAELADGTTASSADRPLSQAWITERLEDRGVDELRVVGEAETRRGTPAADAAHGALALEVHVDRDTGVFDVQRAKLVVDGGRVLNETGYRGQLEGGFVFGLSQACFEHLDVVDGQVVTASLGDYKVACAADVPPLDIELLPPRDSDGRVRGVGELANLGVAPAVANAIDDAVGARVFSLPITAEKVFAAFGASPSHCG